MKKSLRKKIEFRQGFVVLLISIFLCACDDGNLTNPLNSAPTGLTGTPIPITLTAKPLTTSFPPGKSLFSQLSPKSLIDWADLLVVNLQPTGKPSG